MWRWLTGFMKSLRRETRREREVNRNLRMMVVDARYRRLAAAAKREHMTVDAFEDALAELALAHPVTMEEALVVVEQHGLARAQDEFEVCRG